MIFYFADNNAQLGDVLRNQGVSIAGITPAAVSFVALFVFAVATTLYFIHMNPDAVIKTRQP